MDNREKFFELLKSMTNKELSNIVSFSCNECPCSTFCKNNDIPSCNDTIFHWLNLINKEG